MLLFAFIVFCRIDCGKSILNWVLVVPRFDHHSGFKYGDGIFIRKRDATGEPAVRRGVFTSPYSGTKHRIPSLVDNETAFEHRIQSYK